MVLAPTSFRASGRGAFGVSFSHWELGACVPRLSLLQRMSYKIKKITHEPSAELGRGPPQAAWRGSVVHPSGGPSAPGRRCWRLGRKRPPFSNSGPTPLRSDPNLEGLKSLRCCCAKGVGHRAQLMLRARRGARENDYPVPLLRTPTPQSSLSPVLTHSRGVTTTESLELPTEMIWCGSPLSSQPSRWK